MPGLLRALLIDDSADDAEALGRHLEQSGYSLTIRRVGNASALRKALAAERWDVALCKYVMPELQGADALAILQSAAPDLPAIAVTERADDDVALEAMRAGARDCIGKSNLVRLAPVIDREVQARRSATLADGALRIASSWLRLAEDSAIVGFFFHDLQTDKVTFSAQWCANLGYEPRELTEARADFEARFHPLDLDDIRCFVRDQAPAERQTASREFRLRQRDGSYRWVLARTAVDVDAHGTPGRVVGVHIDVTDRKRAEEVLALQAAVADRMAEGVCMMRVSDGRILYVNPGFERLFGYDAGELVGQSPEVLNAATPERSAEETFHLIRDGLVRTGQWSGEVHNRRKDGTPFWTQASVTTTRHPEHGEVWVTVLSDITERRELERAVRASEQRLQQITDTIPQAVWMADAGLDRMIHVSRGYERIWGRTCDSLYANPRSFLAAIHPEDRERVAKELAVERTGAPFEMTYRVVRPDGGVRWVLDRGFPVLDARGAVESYIGLAEDITERRQLETEQRLLTSVVETMAEGVCVIGEPAGVILHANPTFEKMFGYDPGELNGRPASILNAGEGEDPAETTSAIIGALRESGTWQGDIHNRRKDGTPFWTHGTASRLSHPEFGEVWVGTQIEITEYKQLSQRHELILSAAGQGIVELDRQGKIGFVNAAAAHALGCSTTDLVGRDAHAMWLPSGTGGTPCANAECAVCRALEEGLGRGHVRHVFRRADGTTFPVECTTTPILHGTDRLGAVLVFQDITEREWFERLLGIQHELARTVASTGDLREGLVACLDAALSITGFDAGGFYLLDESSQALDLVVHRGVSAAFVESNAHFESDAPQARLVRAGTPQFQRFAEMGLRLRDVDLAEGLVGLAVLPLQHQGRVIGCLNIGSRSSGEFSPMVRQALEVIAAESAQMLDRLQAEAALRSGEARTRMAVEGAELGTWHYDLQTGEVLLSDRCLALLGLPAGASVTSQGLLELVHRDDRGRMAASVVEARDTGTELDIEFRTQWPDGTVRWLVSRGRFARTETGSPGRIEGILLDVTRLRAAEAAERRSEQTLRLFVEYAPAAIAMLDRDMCYLAVSRRCREDYQLGDQPLVGLSHYEVFPNLPESWLDSHRRCLAGASERSEDGEAFPRPDGRIDWVRWECHPWYEAPGEVGGIILFTEVITARKEAEDALRASEERLRLTLEAAHIGTFDWDLLNDRITWTRRHEELWGYAPGEFAGTYAAFSQRVHPDDAKAIEAEVQRCIAMRDDFVRDFRVVWPDGSVHWVSGRGAFTFDESGAPVRMRGVVVDVSDLRRTEAALRVSEREFQSLFANMVEGVVQAQMVFEGGRPTDLILLGVNPAFHTLVGPTNVVGKRMSELLPGYAEAEPEVMAKFAHVAQSGGRERMEAYVAPLRRWFSASVYGTTPGQLILVFEDITVRKEAEARMQALNVELTERVAERTAALEAANRDLEAFNYSISHDLRAPLRHIDGFIRILEEDYAANLPEEAGRYLSLVRTGVVRMNDMIEALLRLSRLGRAAVKPKRCAPAEIARSAFDELRATEPERSVTCEIGALPEVTADPALLRQVYDNLLANALKFTRPVAAARIEVGAERRDGCDVFYVRDNGVGFDAASAVRLFDVFQRLHPAKQFEGTGVGLSIVRRIVERHDGRVWAESSPGHGATFYFTLGAAQL